MALFDTHEGLFIVATGGNSAIEGELPPVLHEVGGATSVGDLVGVTHHTMEVIASEVGEVLLANTDH